MLSVNDLTEYGADTASGLARCVNKEAMYLKLVGKVPSSPDFEALKKNISEKNYAQAFDHAHGLKGILANLSLTPLLDPVCEITELLRAGTDTDYAPLLEKIESERAKLEKLCG